MCKKSIYLVTFISALCLASIATAADPNLVGWWQFEEASGTLYDQSDNHNDGTAYDGVLYQQAGFRSGQAQRTFPGEKEGGKNRREDLG